MSVCVSTFSCEDYRINFPFLRISGGDASPPHSPLGDATGPRKVPSQTGGVGLLRLGRVPLGTTVSSRGVALLGLGRVALGTAVSSGSRDSEPLLMSFRVKPQYMIYPQREQVKGLRG